jgi:hypothetical protein
MMHKCLLVSDVSAWLFLFAEMEEEHPVSVSA